MFSLSLVPAIAITYENTIYYGDELRKVDDMSGNSWVLWIKTIFHEITHVAQYAQLGTVPFLVSYAGEFISKFFSYEDIWFEQEAESQSSLAMKFLGSQLSTIKEVLNSDQLSEEEKYRMLKAMGLKARIRYLEESMQFTKALLKVWQGYCQSLYSVDMSGTYVYRCLGSSVELLTSRIKELENAIRSAKEELKNLEDNEQRTD